MKKLENKEMFNYSDQMAAFLWAEVCAKEIDPAIAGMAFERLLLVSAVKCGVDVLGFKELCNLMCQEYAHVLDSQPFGGKP